MGVAIKKQTVEEKVIEENLTGENEQKGCRVTGQENDNKKERRQ